MDGGDAIVGLIHHALGCLGGMIKKTRKRMYNVGHGVLCFDMGFQSSLNHILAPDEESVSECDEKKKQLRQQSAAGAEHCALSIEIKITIRSSDMSPVVSLVCSPHG